ncbi:hypothetical protein Vretifemale_18485 [Volvox reticuliferus]|uniref:Aldehyde dehydrogenase domain-containing protein n=1 Tax=Volvox reticuliferus TaxID=1737510 RepID=A0A8J4CXG3_9CHLO|nr:hypothetical protein Vretifemale_18485 [Volvox reticuliferus]
MLGSSQVAFTGSAATGRRVSLSAAANLRPASLELGGKSALLVFEDADVEKVVEWAMVLFEGGQASGMGAGGGAMIGSEFVRTAARFDATIIPVSAVGPGGFAADPPGLLTTRRRPLWGEAWRGKEPDRAYVCVCNVSNILFRFVSIQRIDGLRWLGSFWTHLVAALSPVLHFPLSSVSTLIGRMAPAISCCLPAPARRSSPDLCIS